MVVDLPVDVWLHIAAELCIKDCFSLLEVSRHLRGLGEHKAFWMGALQTRVRLDLPVPFPAGFDLAGYHYADLRAFASRLARLEDTSWPSSKALATVSAKALPFPPLQSKLGFPTAHSPVLFLAGTPLVLLAHVHRISCFLVEDDTITEKASMTEHAALQMFHVEFNETGCVLFAGSKNNHAKTYYGLTISITFDRAFAKVEMSILQRAKLPRPAFAVATHPGITAWFSREPDELSIRLTVVNRTTNQAVQLLSDIPYLHLLHLFPVFRGRGLYIILYQVRNALISSEGAILKMGYIPSDLLPFHGNTGVSDASSVALYAAMHVYQLLSQSEEPGMFAMEAISFRASSKTGRLNVSYKHGAKVVFATWHLPEDFPSTTLSPIFTPTLNVSRPSYLALAKPRSALVFRPKSESPKSEFTLARLNSDDHTILSHSFSLPLEDGQSLLSTAENEIMFDEGQGILWIPLMGPTGLSLLRVYL